MTHYYRIHDIISVRSDVDLNLEYFGCEGISGQPDINVQVVDYKPVDTSIYRRIASGLYYSHEGGNIVSNMNLLGLRVAWEVRNIMGPTTELRISKTYLFLSKYVIVFPISSVHGLLPLFRMILQIKMLQRGHTFLVGGCAHQGGRNVIFSGTGGSGKTLSTATYVERFGAEFMSDDLLITDSKVFYSYPSPLRVRKRNVDFLSYSKYMQPNDMFGDRIRMKSNGPAEIYFLETADDEGVEAIPPEVGVGKLCSVTNRALLYFNERILSCIPYVHPNLSLLSMQQSQLDILKERLDGSRFFAVRSRNAVRCMDILEAC